MENALSRKKLTGLRTGTAIAASVGGVKTIIEVVQPVKDLCVILHFAVSSVPLTVGLI